MKKEAKPFLTALSFLGVFSKLAIAQEIYPLEEIKITAPALYDTPEKVAQEVQVIPKEELKNFGYTKTYSGLDVRERGGFGLHENLSIRGTTFEQNLVLFEGVRISSLLTGHSLMNLPFGFDQLKALEILPGGASPLYGAGGLGGALNFLLDTTQPGLDYRIGGGSYNLIEGYLSAGLPITKERTLRLNLEEKKASSFIKNRDFEIKSFNLYSKNPKEVFFYGFIEKDMGARYFYTSLKPTEWEQTRTHLFLTKKQISYQNLSFEPALLYRKNYDYYLFDRYNPSLYKNVHENYLYRLNFPFLVDFGETILSFGAETSYEKVKSSRFGEYLRRNLSFYSGVKREIVKNLNLSLQGRYDYYLGEKDFLSLGAGVAYKLTEALKLRMASNYSYRLPSVIELRYTSIGIRGNPDLSAEKALNLETGLDYRGKMGDLSLSLFYRKGDNLVDWIAYGPPRGTVAENIDVKALGGTIDYRKTYANHLFYLSYTYLNLTGKNLSLARYHGNYLRHNLMLGGQFRILPTLTLKTVLNYRKRFEQEDAYLLDMELEKEFSPKLKVALWGKNLFDEEYYDIKYHGTDKGVLGIPLWLGIRVGGSF